MVVIEPTEEIQRAYSEAWYRKFGFDEEDVQRLTAVELRDPMPWRITALQAVLDVVEPVLVDLTDPDPCSFDQHGHCQAHGWTQTEPRCPHARAKDLMGKGRD